MNNDDDPNRAIDLSTKGSAVRTVPTSLSLKKTSVQISVPVAETSSSGDAKQNYDADVSETKAVIPLPKEHPYVLPKIQTKAKQIKHIIEKVTEQTELVKEVIPEIPTEQVCARSDVTDKKSQELHLAVSDKPNVKVARDTGKKHFQQASASQPSTSHAPTSQPLASQASTLQPSTSKASGSGASTSKTSASKTSTSKASTPKASTSKASTSKASISKASTSKASQASTSQPSTSKASGSGASTSKASASKTSTSKASTPKASTSKASTSKASTAKASTSKASQSKAATWTTSTSKASKSKESTPKATRKASSTATSSKVRKEAGEENLESEPSASTSVAPSSNKSKDSQFWLETVKSKFNSSAYKDFLKESGFTEAQAEVIQNMFHQTARQMYNTFMNSDRVKKTHKCLECAFTLSHQCVSIHFLHVGWPTDDPTEITYIEPQRTNICVCQFAFFHAHFSKPSGSKEEDTASSEHTVPIPEVDRIATLRCGYCDMIILIEHPFHKNTECTLTKWNAINSTNEKTFHAQVVDYMKGFTVTPLTLDEMYACSNRCCLFFHRCSQ